MTVAARLAEEAGADELLVSQRAAGARPGVLEVQRKWRFKVKGVSRELETFAVAPKG